MTSPNVPQTCSPSLPFADLALPLTPSSSSIPTPHLLLSSCSIVLPLLPSNPDPDESHSTDSSGGAFDINVGNVEKTCAERPCAADVVSSATVTDLKVEEGGSSISAPAVQRVVVLMGPA